MASANSVVRWGGIILGGLLAAALIAAGVLFYLVSRLDVKGEVERAVENATGRELTISGTVGVSFWPVLGLRAGEASLANVPGGRAQALALIDDIHVGVEIAPLFRREVVVKQLVLEHPRIALEVDAQGQPNWNLQPRAGAPQPGPQIPDEARPRTFTLSAFRIVRGELTYFDARRNAGWVVTEADLKMALTSLDAPVRVQGGITYNRRRLDVRIDVGQPRAALAGRQTPFEADVQSELLKANFRGDVTSASSSFAGDVTAEGPNLRELAAWAGSPIVGGSGLETFALTGRVDVNAARAVFSNAGFAFDYVRGRGDFELSERHNKPYLSGRLQLYDLDLNPYLTGQMPAPPADSQAPAAAAPANAAAAPTAQIAVVPASDRSLDVQAAPNEAPIDFSGLSAVNADLEITTAALLIQHTRIDSSLVALVINDGYMAATLHRIDLYGGSARGRLEIDAREANARIVQEMTLDGVDAQRFLSDAVNFGNVEGKAEMSYRFESRGRTARELISQADGRFHLEVGAGALRGVDLGGLSRTLSNALNGELIAPNARTILQGFSGTFTVKRGVLVSENLSFNTPDLAITGIGLINLNDHTLAARLAPRSRGSSIVVPFSARGPFGNLAYDTDIRGRFRTELLARVREVARGTAAPAPATARPAATR